VKLQASVNGSLGEAVMGVASGTRGLAVGLPPEPPAGSNGVQVLLLRNGAPLAVDVRNGMKQRQEWEVVVGLKGTLALGTSREIVLSWEGLRRVPGKVSLTLVDLTTSRRQYMRTTSHYRFVPAPGERARRFRIIAERRSVPVLQITSLRAEPGRGRGMNLTFQLSAPAETRVEVLSLSGRRVSLIEAGRRRAAGLQALSWNGLDAQGRPLPAGLYLVRVQATDEGGGRVQAERLVTIR